MIGMTPSWMTLTAINGVFVYYYGLPILNAGGEPQSFLYKVWAENYIRLNIKASNDA